PDDSEYVCRPETASWRASGLTRLVLAWSDGAAIRERRRRNYLQLAGMIGHLPLRPLWSALAAGASPYVFPIQCDAADGLRRFLFEHRVATMQPWRYAHPEIPASAFPDE